MYSSRNLSGTHLHEWIVNIATRAYIQVHVIPTKVLQLFRCEINSGNLIGFMLWRMETIAIIHIDGRIGMPKRELKFKICFNQSFGNELTWADSQLR